MTAATSIISIIIIIIIGTAKGSSGSTVKQGAGDLEIQSRQARPLQTTGELAECC